MASATAQEQTIAGVAGIRFSTDSRPGSDEERRLHEIQSKLSGGVVILPSETTLPHLSLASVATVGGPSHSVISLWVPLQQRSEAFGLRQDAGFTVA